MVRDYRKPNLKAWTPAKIVRKVGAASYLCQVEETNGIWKRHTNQIIRRSTRDDELVKAHPEPPVKVTAFKTAYTNTQPSQRDINIDMHSSSTDNSFQSTPDDSSPVNLTKLTDLPFHSKCKSSEALNISNRSTPSSSPNQRPEAPPAQVPLPQVPPSHTPSAQVPPQKTPPAQVPPLPQVPPLETPQPQGPPPKASTRRTGHSEVSPTSPGATSSTLAVNQGQNMEEATSSFQDIGESPRNIRRDRKRFKPYYLKDFVTK